MDKEKIMNNAKEDKEFLTAGVHLDRVIDYLIISKLNGKNIYVEFNGHKLYSFLDDEDSCFLKVCGATKKELEKQRKEYLEKLEKEREENKKEAQEMVPQWIERGSKIIYPQRQDMWEECVKMRARDLYYGKDLENALDIMEHLEKGSSIEEANKILENANHSGRSYGIVLSIIVSFSKRGPEFYRAVKKDLTKEQIEELEKIEKENTFFARELEDAEKE